MHPTDRMLVQHSYARAGGLPTNFDEEEVRKHPEIEEKHWGEYVVLWKGNNLELYEDHVRVSFPNFPWHM